jgi:hypothetical protein
MLPGEDGVAEQFTGVVKPSSAHSIMIHCTKWRGEDSDRP